MNGSTSRACLYWINALIITLGILVVGFASYALADPQNIETFLTVALPKATFIYSLIFALSLVFISGLGVCGSKTDSKLGLGLYIFIVFAALIAQLAAFIVVLDKYKVIENAKADKYGDEAVAKLETTFVEKCQQNPNDWIKVQNAVKCCGYDARFSSADPSINTGDQCNLGGSLAADVKAIIDVLPKDPPPARIKTATADINKAYVAAGGSGDYFCKDTLVGEAEKYSLPLGITAGVLAFLQLIGLVSASRLACCIRKADGGYMEEWRPSTKEDGFDGVEVGGGPITRTV